MWHLARRSLVANRRRYVAIAGAVCISVAFVSASLVLGDTLSAMFRTIIGEANSNVAVVVRSPAKLSDGGETVRAPIDSTQIARLAHVPGVGAVTPIVFGPGTIIGSDGQRVGGGDAPSLLTNWIDDRGLNGMDVVVGRPPALPDEVVIDQDAVRRGNLKVGQQVTVLTPEPTTFRLVGQVRANNSAGSLGGATVVKAPLATAERLAFGQEGLANEIDIRAKPGVSQRELLQRVRAVVPRNLELITGQEQTDEILGDLNTQFLSFIRVVLLAFAAIAMVAAALTIANCFAIVTNQRVREMALIRSLGAAKSQVLGSALLEAAALGLISAYVGLGVGVVLATGLNWLLGNAMDIATVSPVVTAITVVLSLALGMGVTVLSAVAPIMRMSKVSPVAALRGTAAESSDLGMKRVVMAVLAATTGVGALVAGASGVNPELALVGAGAVAFTVAAVLLAPLLVRPLANAFGLVSGGQSPRFARLNLSRSPRRTASSAAALTVGVAVVSTVTVMAASTIKYVHEAVTGGVAADLIVTVDDGPLSQSLVDALTQRRELSNVTAYETVPAEVDGSATEVGLIDVAGVPKVLNVNGAGSTPWPSQLNADEVVVSTSMATKHNLRIGSTLAVRFLADSRMMRVAGIHSSNEFLGSVAMARESSDGTGSRPTVIAIVANAAPGVSVADARSAANEAVQPLFGPTLRTADGYADSIGKQINQLLGIVYVLLALSVLIALFGIGTSMSLSISERGRELSLLHAIGFDRRRLRRMVRWESAMVAALGTLIGVGIGVSVGSALMMALRHEQFIGALSIPFGMLGVVIAVGIAAGIIASIRPSRRATRLASAV